MVREWSKRPSILVGAWTLLVVAVFVVRGDLRLAAGSPAAATASPAPEAPLVVRRPGDTRSRPALATVSRRGRVFDAMGFLVVGAEVLAMDRPPTRTDADGSFAVELAAGTATDVLVRAEGMQPAWLRTTEGSPDPLVLQLVPAAPWDQPPSPPPSLPALRGEGVVAGPDGQPLAAAFVTALGSGLWARTDDIGRFVLPLPASMATLLVHDPDGGVDGRGFAGLAAPFVSPRASGAVPVPDLAAAPAAGLRGVVRDARGNPVAGVPVVVRGDHLLRVVETGAGGVFRLGGLPNGKYEARPFPWRGAIGTAQQVSVAGGTGVIVDVDLQLQIADEVRLRVVDEAGSPLGGVHVAANAHGLRRGVAQADADGYAAVPITAGTGFDVRTPPTWAALTVRRFDAEPATLVVAAP